MNSHVDIAELLALIREPAFYVTDGFVQVSNDAAVRLFIEPGMSITKLFSPTVEYKDLIDGCMYFSASLNKHPYGITVQPVQDGCIYTLDSTSDDRELRTLALTAANMRQPLSAMIASADNLAQQLSTSDDPKVREHLDYLNRNLTRMHRTLCNMSDVVQYAQGHSGNMAMQDIVSVISSVFQHAQALAAHRGITFDYQLPQEPVYCVIDAQLLERAVYNMISNALKFSEANGTVLAKLVHSGHRISISITDQGCGIQPQLISSVFHRYQRCPGLDDGRFGLGLGLALVRCAAVIHNGTVLLDKPEGIGTRITLSFPITQTSSAILRSTGSSVDYAGGWDHALLELSDVLPSHLYREH